MHSSGEKDWYATTMPVRAAIADAAFGERMARLAEIAAQKGTTARYLGKALAAAAALDQIAGDDQALRTALRRRPLQSLLAIERLLKHDATAAQSLAERLAFEGLTVQAVEEEERRLRGALRPSTVKTRSNEAAAFEERAVEVLSKEYPSFSLASVVGRIGRRANAKAKLVRGLGDLASLYSVPFDQVWRNSAGELLLVELFFVPEGRPALQVEAQAKVLQLGALSRGGVRRGCLVTNSASAADAAEDASKVLGPRRGVDVLSLIGEGSISTPSHDIGHELGKLSRSH